MNIELIVLCDAATDSQGKLNILGAFDCIWAPQLPTFHAQCAIALRIRFDRFEEGEHRLKINVVDEDGKPIMPSLEAGIKLVLGPDHETSAANVILNIHQLKLDKLGHYEVDVAIDDRRQASIPFFVRELKRPDIPPAQNPF